MQAERGHTLIELMVTLTLGAMVVAAAFHLYVIVSTEMVQLREHATLTREAEAVGVILAQPVGLAGYHQFALLDEIEKHVSGPVRNITFKSALSQRGLLGCDRATLSHDGWGGAWPCAAGPPEFDLIAIRYSPWHAGADHPDSRLLHHKSVRDCAGTILHKTQSDLDQVFFTRPTPTATAAERPGAKPLHTLYCRSNAKGRMGYGDVSSQPLVEGLEAFRIRYYVRYPRTGDVALLRAHQIGDSEWRHVTGIELCVRLRGHIPQVQAQTMIDCDGVRQPVAVTDQYQRVTRRFVIRAQSHGFR